MCLILIDILVLMACVKAIGGDDIDFWPAALFGVIASIATAAIVFAMTMALGFAGIIVAAILASIGIGIAVSAIYGIEIKRSVLIGLIFVVVDLGFRIGLFFAMGA